MSKEKVSMITVVDTRNKALEGQPSHIVHSKGLPHRVVHVEILHPEDLDRFLILTRFDGRLEILGAHFNWLCEKNRSETESETTVRESEEEICLVSHLMKRLGLTKAEAEDQVRRASSRKEITINQYPTGKGEPNNEFVYVMQLRWDRSWGDATDLLDLIKEQSKPEVIDLVWLKLDKIIDQYSEWSAGCNVALRGLKFWSGRAAL